MLTFVLKILTLILVDSCFKFHMFFNCRNAVVALPILAFTSAPDPPCSSMMLLTKYVNVSTSSRVSPSSVIDLAFSVLYLRILLYPLCMMRPIDAEAAATLVALICICSCVWDRKAKSSAKFNLSN